MQRTGHLGLLLAITAIAACVAWVFFFVLWRDYLLYALAASALLLGGATALPGKNAYLHGLSIGLCFGAFVGSAFGAVKCFGPDENLPSSRFLEPARVGSPPFTAQLQA